jgi:hypothetical protein
MRVSACSVIPSSASVASTIAARSAAGVRWQPQHRRVAQRLPCRQAVVHQIVLGHQADAVAHRGQLVVHVVVVVGHRAGARTQLAGEDLQQGGLARTGRAHHREELARPHPQLHTGQQRLAVRQVISRPRCDEVRRRRSGRHEVLAVDDQVRASERHAVPVGHHGRAGHRGTVDENPVTAPEVSHPPAPCDPVQPSVPTGDPHVVEDDVVVRVPSDGHHGVALVPVRWRVDREFQHLATRRPCQPHHRAASDAVPAEPHTVHPRPVRGVQVLDEPAAPVPDPEMVLGDPWVVDRDVTPIAPAHEHGLRRREPPRTAAEGHE